MQIPCVVPCDPSDERLFQFQRTGPFAEPDEFFFERPHKMFCIGVALVVVVSGECLRDAQIGTGLQKGDRGRLKAIVTHQMKAVVTARERELALHGRVQRGQPLRRLRLEADVVANDLYRVPVHHDYDIHPAEGLDHDLGHVNAPPLIRRRGPGLAPRWRPSRL